jgi:hypothetical protein
MPSGQEVKQMKQTMKTSIKERMRNPLTTALCLVRTAAGVGAVMMLATMNALAGVPTSQDLIDPAVFPDAQFGVQVSASSNGWGLAISNAGLDASTAMTVTPRPTHEVLLNPGKGWVLYGMPEWQVPTAMVMGNIGYERFQWSDLEPVEGQFNWKKLEDALAGWDKAGKQFAFGVMCASSHSKSPYVTPKWVFDAGAKHRLIDLNTLANPYAGVPGQKAVPEFYDPVFLLKLKNFLNAMGIFLLLRS